MVKLKTFIAPAVRLPHDYAKREGKPVPHRGYFKSEHSQQKPKLEKTSKSELQQIYSEIKEYSSTAFTGLAKKKHKEDKLTKLGAPPAKEQTMPFKMKMGILAGRKKREQKMIAEAKQAGIVLAENVTKKAKKPTRNDKKGRSRSDRDDIGPKTVGGVLRIGKNFMAAGRHYS